MPTVTIVQNKIASTRPHGKKLFFTKSTTIKYRAYENDQIADTARATRIVCTNMSLTNDYQRIGVQSIYVIYPADIQNIIK